MTGLPRRGWCNRAAALAVLIGATVAIPLSTSSAVTPSTWTLVPAVSPSVPWSSVNYLNGQWIVLSRGGEVATSTNASTWTEQSSPSGSWQTIAYGDGHYVALSSADVVPNEIISSNAVQWTSEVGPPGTPQQAGRAVQSGQWTSITYGGGLFVAVSSVGTIATSPNGLSWTERFWRPLDDFTSVTYGDGKFIAVDAHQGNVLMSLNGTKWSDIFQPLTGGTAAPSGGLHFGAVAYGNGNFVAFGDSSSGAGYVATSDFGYTWTLHQYSPAQQVDAATFGCGSFIAAGASSGSANSILTSVTGAIWGAAAVTTPTASTWTSVAYGANQYVAVDNSGDIVTAKPATSCADAVPSPPQQVSGNVRSGEVRTYMHPSERSGGAPVQGYRVAITDSSGTTYCHAAATYQPDCVVKGLTNHEVYWVTAQAYNRFGFSAPTDPEFAIPVANSSLAIAAHPDLAAAVPSALQLTGITANASGFYPVTKVKVYIGPMLTTCAPNPFGECLIHPRSAPSGVVPVYSTYTGWSGRSYRSPTYHLAIPTL
ncbi:MAG: fibronectin type III domain-containing protein [Acidimicrobiales bacterium]